MAHLGSANPIIYGQKQESLLLSSAKKKTKLQDIDQSEYEFDADQFLFDKKSALEHFFAKVHDELANQPAFALHFFLSFSK